jgi:hypothetical protein
MTVPSADVCAHEIKNMDLVVTIVLILIAIVMAYIIFMTIKNAVSGPTYAYKASELAQPATFYTQMRGPTIQYLSAVYPTATDTLNSMSDTDLALFYNSLWFYYNCAGKGNYNMPQSLSVNNDAPFNLCWNPINGCEVHILHRPMFLKDIYTPSRA